MASKLVATTEMALPDVREKDAAPNAQRGGERLFGRPEDPSA